MRDWPPKPNPRYERAVFLDRDGTINVDTHFPHRVESLEFIPKAVEGLRVLSALPLHIIVVSNQAGIALNIFTVEQMSQFNTELRTKIEHAGAHIDAFYFCPHLEAKHLASGVSACACSKPSPGMLLEAAKEFQLDLSRSYLIGDKTSDIAVGERVGCVTILLRTGKAGREEGALSIESEYLAENLYEAALLVQVLLEHDSKVKPIPARYKRL
ncbi:MAG: HAD family hydrolase [Dehalococcoidia bacterium]|nr:HAD family hydrolase [Dehalococcoidia bacterium]